MSSAIIKANDPTLRSWVQVDKDSDFPIQNLPLGIYKDSKGSYRVCSAIGDFVIDLSILHDMGYLEGLDIDGSLFRSEFLNDIIALGKEVTSRLRARLSDILNADIDFQSASSRASAFLFPMNSVVMSLPLKIGDYTDFYSSREHATNVGMMFRDPKNALLPNWLHLPVGYHGRASSVVVSGTPIRRPKGQLMPDGADSPVFGETKLLDFELEMAFVVGKSNELGSPIRIEDAEDYIYGMVLFNDWSARDIQKWEYVPLGPFGAKNFASTISPWVISLEALEPFRVPGPRQDPEVLSYLRLDKPSNFDIELSVEIVSSKGFKMKVCQSNFKYMYWSMAQQLTHHTITGCNMRVGDLCASGTISGPEPHMYGSMLELTWKGTKPIVMPDGSTRKFLQDGDEVRMRAYGIRPEGIRIGFGPCDGGILPAL